jgi:uncharacterized membrane protein YdjX (TVP38/TMEM64 family)
VKNRSNIAPWKIGAVYPGFTVDEHGEDLMVAAREPVSSARFDMNDSRRFPGLSGAALAVGATALTGCDTAPIDVVGWIESSAGHPLAPFVVIAVFIVSGFVAAPLSLVMIPTIVVFGPLAGSLWTVIGATLSGALFFWLGSRGSALVDRFRNQSSGGTSLGRLVERNGVVAVAIARNLPLGPYPVVNLALGASPIRMSHFLIGNLIGLTPWIVLYAATGSQARQLLENPSPETWMRLGAVFLVLVGLTYVTSRALARRGLTEPDPEHTER